MPKYVVDVTAEYYVTYTVEAESEDRANEIACDLFCDDYNNEWDSLTCTSEVVDETYN